ncbi:hypothetical protein B0O80DRAFT_445503 [Mortierella sp. GBAus27b]|nr:hypothetical protein B0O80DRAFT_445503 [Mortierella sp. GBAus27b]
MAIPPADRLFLPALALASFLSFFSTPVCPCPPPACSTASFPLTRTLHSSSLLLTPSHHDDQVLLHPPPPRCSGPSLRSGCSRDHHYYYYYNYNYCYHKPNYRRFSGFDHQWCHKDNRNWRCLHHSPQLFVLGLRDRILCHRPIQQPRQHTHFPPQQRHGRSFLDARVLSINRLDRIGLGACYRFDGCHGHCLLKKREKVAFSPSSPSRTPTPTDPPYL